MSNDHLEVRARNSGTASSLIHDGALTIDLTIPPGTIGAVGRLAGFSSYENLCKHETGSLRPCSAARADILRLKTHSWRPNDFALARLSIKGNPPARVSGSMTMYIDDGRIESDDIELATRREE
jgi:hypothetical protein